nr:uncharacterized protein LOC108132268 [Drosophila bipectinata]
MSKSKRSNNHQPIRGGKSFNPFSQTQSTNSENIFSNKGNAVTLVRFYAGHECLWNRENADYFNNKKKHDLWEWIARQFGGKLSRQQVEFEAKRLHKRALQELKRLHSCQEKGLPCTCNFELLNEFLFLIPNDQMKESYLGSFLPKERGLAPNITSKSDLQTKKKTQNQDDLTVFCSELRERLSQLPPHVRLQTQKKILLIMHRSKGGVDRDFVVPEMLLPGPSKK